MKAKYIFVSILISIVAMTVSAEGTDYPNSKKELVKIIRERDAEIANLRQERDKLLKEQEQIVKLQFEMDIYRKALMDANVPLPDLAKIEKGYISHSSTQEKSKKTADVAKIEKKHVFRSSIQEHFKKPLSVGQVAYLKEKSFLVRNRVFDQIQESTQTFIPKIQQIIDEQNMLVRLPKEVSWVGDITVWITGVSTVGFADGTDFVNNEPFAITGTKKYTTALGDNTVFVLEPVEISTH